MSWYDDEDDDELLDDESYPRERDLDVTPLFQDTPLHMVEREARQDYFNDPPEDDRCHT